MHGRLSKLFVGRGLRQCGFLPAQLRIAQPLLSDSLSSSLPTVSLSVAKGWKLRHPGRFDETTPKANDT
jgi:hypothetical protein